MDEKGRGGSRESEISGVEWFLFLGVTLRENGNEYTRPQLTKF